MHKTSITIFIILSINFSAFSQKPDSLSVSYKPVIFGILKTKSEWDLDNSKMRFEVRNARFGFKGNINPLFGYKAEIDLSDEGKIRMLDAYVKLTPLKGLDFYLGQRKIPFSTDYIRNPAENFFANRSFVAKYINDGLRDIGFYANYRHNGDIPVDIFIGAMNGTGNNNPQWVDHPNFAGRILLGKENGFRIASNVYIGEVVYRENMRMFGQEIRFVYGPFLIESEYVARSWTDTSSVRQNDDGFYVHSFYRLNVKNPVLSYLAPTARWDWMSPSAATEVNDASRMTLGLNLGFESKMFSAEIRINYENYFRGVLPIHTDKLTLEFVGVF
jgi:Phosphate-selective porin O and P